jgi:Stage II sporulation protein E (SpoIIE)
MPMPEVRTPLQWTVIANPFPGQRAPSGRWAVFQEGARFVAALLDPSRQSREALVVRRSAGLLSASGVDPVERFRQLHRALSGTEGASLAIVELDADRSRLAFYGLGSIRARIDAGGDSVWLESAPGLLGVGRSVVPPRVDASWPPDAALLLVSDGVVERWPLDAIPPVGATPPEVFAAEVTALLGRLPDDGVMLVLRA